MSLKGPQTTKAIGARFRSARSLVPQLNRKSFCDKHEINRYTMQSWENGLHISKGKNVAKFIDALAKEGISCTTDWLFDGMGESARPFGDFNCKTDQFAEQPQIAENGKLAEGALALISIYERRGERLISYTINDDSMRPIFCMHDTVIGSEILDNLPSVHQKFCLVKLNPERIILRKALTTKDGILLMALDERVPTLQLGPSAQIYRVIWHHLGH